MTTASASFYDLSSPPVLQPQLDTRTLAIRRPSSVATRSTTTRRHRSNRSHHGGAAYAPQNEFPNFAHTGDVEIIVSAGGQEKRYTLHRLILARSSGFFEASTSEEWSRGQGHHHGPSGAPQGRESALGRIGEEDEGSQAGRPSTSTGQKPFWRYELDTGNETDEMPMLVQTVSVISCRKEAETDNFISASTNDVVWRRSSSSAATSAQQTPHSVEWIFQVHFCYAVSHPHTTNNSAEPRQRYH